MSKSLSVLLDRFIPLYIREEYSTFTDFIKVYLEYTEQEGEVQRLIFDFLNFLDIDKVSSDDPYDGNETILELFVKQYLSSFPLYRIEDIDIGKLIKNSKDFYSCKGTETSFQYLFRLMNHGGSFSFYYPSDDILICSDPINGLLSDEKGLHDNYYKAFYTYEIISTLYGAAEIKDIIENVIHPSGCKVFFRRIIESEAYADPYEEPTAELFMAFAFAIEDTEYLSYMTNDIIYESGNVTFEDVENGNAGILSEMTMGEDWGDTFYNLETANGSQTYYRHQLHCYREVS